MRLGASVEGASPLCAKSCPNGMSLKTKMGNEA